jgi:hypothetical protein
MHFTLLHHAATAEREHALRTAERFGPLLDTSRTARRRRRATAAIASTDDRSEHQR